MKTIRKAKNAFIYTIDGQKYYDLTANTNIIGHSHRLLTNMPKNALSTAWNIRGKSIWHNRFAKLISTLFGEGYTVRCASSLTDLWLRMANFGIVPDFDSDDTLLYLESHSVKMPQANKNIRVVEAASHYINNEEIPLDENVILNGWWYPELDMPLGNAKAVILPELFSGLTPTVFVLLRHDCEQDFAFLDRIENVPSFTVISAVNLYHIIRNQQKRDYNQLRLDSTIVQQRGRIFKLSGDAKDYADKFAEKHILLNQNKPQYNYLPINLEHYQIKYLNKVFDELQ